MAAEVIQKLSQPVALFVHLDLHLHIYSIHLTQNVQQENKASFHIFFVIILINSLCFTFN